MKNAIIEEIAGNWEVMAAMEDAAHPARRATFRECADLLRSMAASDKSGEHEQQLEELVRSACAIADRRGAETAWDRFTASAKSLGLNGVTARTYRILPSDEPAQEAEQAAPAAVIGYISKASLDEMPLLNGRTHGACPAIMPRESDVLAPAVAVYAIPQPAATAAVTLLGFDRDDLDAIADGLESGYEKAIDVGGSPFDSGPNLVASTTAVAARFIRAALAQPAAPAVTDAARDVLADAKDGARYRWLRENCYDTDPAGEGDAFDHPALHFESAELGAYDSSSLDAAIDAEIESRTQSKE